MGIHNLTGFIDQNQHLLNDHQLHDCSVVIDGNNFYYYIYGAFNIQYQFGGDYDIFRKSIMTIFESFKKCSIVPYVVMDGAYARDGRKLKTSLARATSKIHKVKSMIYTHRGCIIPALAYDTFMQTLSELGIHHATCQFEADLEIAVLANKFKCPVISNDSDFFIFDLCNGFLPLDYIDFRPLFSKALGTGTGYNYLQCRIYHVDGLISSFDGLNRTVLPVFASLLGNDFVEPTLFDAFYAHVKVPKLVSKKFSLSPKLAKVISALYWLQSRVEDQDITAIKEQILSFIHSTNKGKVERLLMTSVNGYIDVNNFNGFDLFEYFTGSSHRWHMGANDDFNLFNGAFFPDWFVSSVCKGEITPSTLNAAISHRVIIPTQVEDLQAPSSFLCSEKLRKALYAVLLKEDLPPALVKQNAGEKMNARLIKSGFKAESNDSDEETNSEIQFQVDENDFSLPIKLTRVEEYNRIETYLKKCYIPLEEKIDDLCIPGLSKLPDLSTDMRMSVLESAMEVDFKFILTFPLNMQLFIACLIHWVQHANPNITRLHIHSMLVCIIFLKILSHLEERKKSSKNSKDKPENGSYTDINNVNIDQICHSLNIDILVKIKTNIDKYHKKLPNFNHKTQFDPKIVHGFAQLQACMLDASNLNKVLCSPLLNLRPSDVFNGTFLYNIFIELQSRVNPESFITNLLENDSQLCNFFQSCQSVILEAAGICCLEEHLSSKRKIKRRRCKFEKKKKMSVEASASETADGDDDGGVITVAGFDINNRFHVLGFES